MALRSTGSPIARRRSDGRANCAKRLPVIVTVGAPASPSGAFSRQSQRWRLVRERFDDGGYSGGSMERPALQSLLNRVRERRIDVIVVYKSIG